MPTAQESREAYVSWRDVIEWQRYLEHGYSRLLHIRLWQVLPQRRKAILSSVFGLLPQTKKERRLAACLLSTGIFPLLNTGAFRQLCSTFCGSMMPGQARICCGLNHW